MAEMTKQEMTELIAKLQGENQVLVAKVGSKEKGRKDQVLELIRSNGKISIKDLALQIGISERNISSQLSYLRKDGLKFGKNSKGLIYEEKDE